MTQEVQKSDTVEVTKSLMPFLSGGATEEKKAEYLSYRFTGFSVREACALAKIDQSTVQRWRSPTIQQGKWYDETFAELERECTGVNRGKIRKEVIALLFTRNFHLVLRRDGEILMRVLGMEKEINDQGIEVTVPPSAGDIKYLEKARSHYGPQQLEVLERMLDPEMAGGEFDFTRWTIERTRVVREMEERTVVNGEG